MAGPVVLQVEGRVEEGEIGEQPLGGAPHGKLEQVVIRLAGVVVDPLLDPEDLDGEDGGLSVPQAGLGGQHDVLHHHAPLGGGVHAVVDGGEGGLGPGPGVHSVQVVDQGLHSLIGGPVGLLHRPLVGEGLGPSPPAPPCRRREPARPARRRSSLRSPPGWAPARCRP